MRNKLELKHLAPYFPYGLNCLVIDKEVQGVSKIAKLEGLYSNSECVFHDLVESQQGFEKVTPILRPISDLSKEVFHNEEKIIPLHEILMEDRFFTKGFLELFGHESCKYSTVKKLLEYHFDIFGLIEKGLAVDINTIKYSN